jgi:hypothetical protein
MQGGGFRRMSGMNGQVSVKTHRAQGQIVVAMCDAELIGRKLKDGKIQITLNDGFYSGELFDPDENGIFNLIRGASSYNIFGERSIAIAVKYNLVDRATVRLVDGVPHAQVYCL